MAQIYSQSHKLETHLSTYINQILLSSSSKYLDSFQLLPHYLLATSLFQVDGYVGLVAEVNMHQPNSLGK